MKELRRMVAATMLAVLLGGGASVLAAAKGPCYNGWTQIGSYCCPTSAARLASNPVMKVIIFGLFCARSAS